MRPFQKTVVSLVAALLAVTAPVLAAAPIRVTTWNLQWFPNGSPKEKTAEEQARRVAAAADVLRPLNADIILLQEVKDYDACARLAEAIQPNTYHVAICSAFREGNGGIGRQQVAILAKEHAQAAWSEPWKSMDGVDPPRGFVFAWFKIAGQDVGVYSLHLKSNLIMKSDKTVEAAKNIRKREVSIEQLLTHIRDVIATAMPMVKGFVVGGDFNTNPDQPDFAAEKTLTTLTAAGFRNSVEGIPLTQRITHPGSGPYPDATFDYLFASNLIPAKPLITSTKASDHLPVTCDFSKDGTVAETKAAPAASPVAKPPVPVTKPPVPAAKTTPSPPAQAKTAQFVTLTQPVKIKIPYGETVLPRGLKLPVLSQDAQNVTVSYFDQPQVIPKSATDLQ